MKKFFLILIFFLIFLTCCTKNNHEHEFILHYDTENHFLKCNCGEVEQINNHIFQWVIDKEPTTEQNGIKHEECTICEYQHQEYTEIPKMDKHTIILEIPTPQNSISFKDGEELEKYILSIEDMRFLYIKEVTKKNEQLNVYNTDYRFNFDGENAGEHINQYVSVKFSVYSDFLGTDTGDNEYVLYHSISFLFNLKSYGNIDELRFEFFNYKNDKYIYNNVIYIYQDDIKIGEVYYYEMLNISHEWIKSFIIENLKG